MKNNLSKIGLSLLVLFIGTNIFTQPKRDYASASAKIGAKEMQSAPIMKNEFISFEFSHSLRIPDNHVLISITNRCGKVSLRIKSEPAKGYQEKSEYTMKDTTFQVSTNEYQRITSKFRNIMSSDIFNENKEFFAGVDGTTCKLAYGDSNASISYSAWTPEYKTYKRGLSQFLDCCKSIVTLSGLKMKDFFE